MPKQIRLGIIVPSSNTTMEMEFNKIKPKNASIHAARMKLRKVTAKSLMEMEAEAEKEAMKLADAKVDVIAYGCTTGSLVKGANHATKIEEIIMKATGLPAVATANSVIRALKELNAAKIAVATPYIKELNQLEKTFLQANGFKVTKIIGLEIEDNTEIGKLQPQAAYELALKANTPEAEAIFISCTNFRTIEIIEKLERELGKPVISSNIATLWDMLRKIKYKGKIQGYGKLLQSI